MIVKKILAFSASLCLFVGAITALTNQPSSAAISADDWRAGNIIDDTIFYDGDAMSVNDIQQFLNSLVPTCDTWGTKPHETISGKTRAQVGTEYGNPPPYICMKDYYENPSTKETNFNPTAAIPSGALSAAQIIYNASKEFNINPKVLLVTIKKEAANNLIQDDWPWVGQYRSALGFGCPDTAACDSQYYGFYNQVRNSARQFRLYADYPNSYRRKAGSTYAIQYHPNGSCASPDVYLQNQATAGLYNFTPYQPNSAALKNMPGTGDSCSSYGNRNFWYIWNSWFGSTRYHKFVTLDTPRWMQIKNEGAQKIDVATGNTIGESFTQGRQIKFVDKVLISGKWYLRTEFNYNDGGQYAIAQDNLEEIPYQPITPKWVTFIENGNRSHPASRTSIGDNLIRGTSVKVVDQIVIDSNIYYRTEFNSTNRQDVGIHSRFVTDFAPILLDGPRSFCATAPINKIDPTTNSVASEQLHGSFFINKKTLINGVWYYQAEVDNNTSRFFNSSNLQNVCYVPFEGPRNMQIKKDVVRFNPYTSAQYDTLRRGAVIAFSTKIYINNQWYFRTAHNTLNNVDAVVPASAVGEL